MVQTESLVCKLKTYILYKDYLSHAMFIFLYTTWFKKIENVLNTKRRLKYYIALFFSICTIRLHMYISFHISLADKNLKAICSGCAIRVKSSEIMGKVCPRTADREKKKSKNRNSKVNIGCCWWWVLMLLVRWCSKMFLLFMYTHIYILVISFREKKRTDDGMHFVSYSKYKRLLLLLFLPTQLPLPSRQILFFFL